ncbi:MAG: hypothetical protein LW817_04530 [Candidatus Caenarcaniphilales bacterium]|jgi:NAD(P)H-quinone oxidoreductase subunit 2|nr:hypothetical protein [Candidatus Caenarcaniphilales bacterium]
MNLSLIAQLLSPELIIVVGILLSLIFSVFNKLKNHTAGITAVFFALASLACLKLLGTKPTPIMFGSFNSDALSVFFRFLIYSVSFVIVLSSQRYLKVIESPAEYYPIFLGASLGAGLLTGVNDLLFLFVALETLGLCAILLASYARLNKGSNEAGIKYLVSSSVATSILLLGIAFIYGLTGATNFKQVSSILANLNAFGLVSMPLLILISVCFIFSIAFKLGAVPFHNWSPDVYQGAPTTTTVFLSVVSKTAAFGLAIRLFTSLIVTDLNFVLFSTIAIASIILGNYVGLVQMLSRGSLKRLLAYSSIAQAGYLLIGLAVCNQESISGLINYLTIYAIMNTGAFLGAIYFEQVAHSDKIYDYAGLIQKRPLATIATSLCLINLAGLPFIPAGFIAKFFLFSSAFASGTGLGQLLAIVGLLGSLVALFYYLYFVKIMVVDAPSTAVKQLDDTVCPGLGIKSAFVLTLLVLIDVGVFGMQLLGEISNSIAASVLG